MFCSLGKQGDSWLVNRTIASCAILLLMVSTALGADYGTNLASPDVYWGSVLSNDRLPFVADKGIVSEGPYFIDINHRESALLVGPLVVWVNDHKPDGEFQTPLGRIDLTNTKIRLNVKFKYEPQQDEYDARLGGRVVFWFQSALSHTAVPGGDFMVPTRAANYVYNRNLLSDSISGKTVEIPVTPDLNQWTCLGDNPRDTRPFIGSAAKYTCALNQEEFAQAMSHPADMGILFLLPGQKPDGSDVDWLQPDREARTLAMAKTKFVLKEFTILRPTDGAAPPALIAGRSAIPAPPR